MAAYMSRKCLLHFCRQILLPRHVQPTDCQKFGSHLQAYRSLFSVHGLIQHATFQKTSSVPFQPTGPSLIQACHKRVGLSYSTSSQSAEETLQPQATSNADVDEPDDKLYKWIELRVKGHDDAVLDSYAKFVDLAADELDITVDSIAKPTRHIKKLTLLKSRHVYKKHRAQYEFRTYYRVIKLEHLTGSTASIFLEYIERNLPEGLAMQVKKCSIQRLPEHLTSRPEDLEDNPELTSSSSSSDSDSGSDIEGEKIHDLR